MTTINRRVLRDLLLLVDRAVPVKVIQEWSDKQCRAAGEWAGRVHLAASDNPVRVPAEPHHVRQYRPRQNRPVLAHLRRKSQTPETT